LARRFSCWRPPAVGLTSWLVHAGVVERAPAKLGASCPGPSRDLGEGEPSFRTSTGGAAQRRVGGRDRPFGAAQVEVAPLPPCHAPNCPPMPVPPMPRGCHPPMPHATFPACTAHAGALSMGKAPCGCWHFWGAGAPAPHCAHQRCSAGGPSVAAWVRGPSVGAGGFVARSAQGSFKGQAGCGTSRPLHVGATCRSNHWPPKGPRVARTQRGPQGAGSSSGGAARTLARTAGGAAAAALLRARSRGSQGGRQQQRCCMHARAGRRGGGSSSGAVRTLARVSGGAAAAAVLHARSMHM
jgi:hypothetical protein